MITKFDDFIRSINESNSVNVDEAKITVKRKYTEKHPAKELSTAAPVRNKVLEFIDKNKRVSKKELYEFFDQMGESTGKRPSSSWVNKNSSLVQRHIDEDGNVEYSLTKRGKKVLEMTKSLMESFNEVAIVESNSNVDTTALKQIFEKGVVPKIEINTERAEDECIGNKFVGELHCSFKELVFTFGEPAIRTKFLGEWYLYDKKTKISYTIRNKENTRYRRAPGVPFELFCNVSKGFDAVQFIQSIIDVEQEWVKVVESFDVDGNCVVIDEGKIAESGHSFNDIADSIYNDIIKTKKRSNWRDVATKMIKKYTTKKADINSIIDILSSEEYFDDGEFEFDVDEGKIKNIGDRSIVDQWYADGTIDSWRRKIDGKPENKQYQILGDLIDNMPEIKKIHDVDDIIENILDESNISEATLTALDKSSQKTLKQIFKIILKLQNTKGKSDTFYDIVDDAESEGFGEYLDKIFGRLTDYATFEKNIDRWFVTHSGYTSSDVLSNFLNSCERYA